MIKRHFTETVFLKLSFCWS